MKIQERISDITKKKTEFGIEIKAKGSLFAAFHKITCFILYLLFFVSFFSLSPRLYSAVGSDPSGVGEFPA